ncbi:hypothetical protein N657DRAFT_303141 [Parathielavia appendiculata]|uniref:Uncharacterized protein n=1 Tax=Parathielavia appendiculata TaxID=2587402 RepID=A0AAN6Z5V5_9PEZI|nr:hypothetical protein N657DRAFT_303141 [Parathielavia appendiculata]
MPPKEPRQGLEELRDGILKIMFPSNWLCRQRTAYRACCICVARSFRSVCCAALWTTAPKLFGWPACLYCQLRRLVRPPLIMRPSGPFVRELLLNRQIKIRHFWIGRRRVETPEEALPSFDAYQYSLLIKPSMGRDQRRPTSRYARLSPGMEWSPPRRWQAVKGETMPQTVEKNASLRKQQRKLLFLLCSIRTSGTRFRIP